MNIHFTLLETLVTTLLLAVFKNWATGIFRFFGCLASMSKIRFPLISLFICLEITVISGSSGMFSQARWRICLLII